MNKLFRWPLVLCLGLGPTLLSSGLQAQQFNGDNQWVAPKGVATLVATAGEDYGTALLVVSPAQDWEVNLMATHYWDDPRGRDDSYTATNLFAKHRLVENEAGTAGYAFTLGTGHTPEHTAVGRVTKPLRTWWGNFVMTYAFADNRVTWDLVPGIQYNLEQDQVEDPEWGFTYGSRVAVADVLPSTSFVAEVFGTAGEAYAEPSYRLGLRWESPQLILAGTFSDAFNGEGGAGFEVGVMYLTDRLF